MTDFTVQYHGTITIIAGVSEACEDHLAERMPDDCPEWGGGYAVESRFVDDIVCDLESHGFVGMEG